MNENSVIVVIAAINFLSAFIQGATGSGYAIIAMFLMPMVIPYQQCSIISAAVIIVIAVQMTYSLRKHICIKKVILPMFFCMLTTGVGVWMIYTLDEVVLRKIMGVFLLLLCVFFLITERRQFKVAGGKPAGVIFGLLTGVATGMFNIVGPFLNVYYFSICKDNLEYKGNLEFSFLIAGCFSLCLNLKHTRMNYFLSTNIIVSGIAAVLAGFLGLKVYRKLKRNELKWLIVGILPIIGIIQFLR